MGDERCAFDIEVASHIVEILDLAIDRETRRVGRELRAPGAALVVEDDRVPRGERREIAGDALEIHAGTAVDRDDRVAAPAEHAIEETRGIRRGDVALTHGHAGDTALCV